MQGSLQGLGIRDWGLWKAQSVLLLLLLCAVACGGGQPQQTEAPPPAAPAPEPPKPPYHVYVTTVSHERHAVPRHCASRC